MLGFPQFEEPNGDIKSPKRRTICIDIARSKIEHGGRHGARAWRYLMFVISGGYVRGMLGGKSWWPNLPA